MSEIVNDAVVEAVSSQLPEVTDEHVAMVLSAYESVISGPALGTVVMDPASGQIAMRVSVDGIHQWRITAPDGGVWGDMRPALPEWVVIRDGSDE